MYSSRNLDMKNIVGEHELSSVQRSFMNSNGELNAGGEAKSELDRAIYELIPRAMTKLLNLNEIDVIVIDAMTVLQKLRKDNIVANFEDLSSTQTLTF